MLIDTEVCNTALANVAVGTSLSDVETEDSIAAKTCRLFYRRVLEAVHRDFLWPKHKRTAALAEVTNENPAWGKAYRYPNDCVFFRRIVNGTTFQTPQNQIPFELGRDAISEVIFTNEEKATGEWTVVIEDPTKWDADFYLAFTRLLGFYVAPRLTGGDQFKLGQQQYQLYLAQKGEAQRNALNEQQEMYRRDSGFSRSRR